MSYDLLLHKQNNKTPLITIDALITKLSNRFIILNYEVGLDKKHIYGFTIKPRAKNALIFEFYLQQDLINLFTYSYDYGVKEIGIFRYVVAEVAEAFDLLIDDPQEMLTDILPEELMDSEERSILRSTKDVYDPEYTDEDINIELRKEEKSEELFNLREEIYKNWEKSMDGSRLPYFMVEVDGKTGNLITSVDLQKDKINLLIPSVDLVHISLPNPLINSRYSIFLKDLLEIIGSKGYQEIKDPILYIRIFPIDKSHYKTIKSKGKLNPIIKKIN